MDNEASKVTKLWAAAALLRLEAVRKQCEYNCPDDPPWGMIEDAFVDAEQALCHIVNMKRKRRQA